MAVQIERTKSEVTYVLSFHRLSLTGLSAQRRARDSFEISRSNNRARGILMRLTHSSGRTGVSPSPSLRDHAATVVLNVTLFMPVMSAHKFQPAGLIGNADAYTDSCVRRGKKFRNFDRTAH